MSWLTLALLILATFRLSHLIALEAGPGRVFDRLRMLLGATYDVRGGAWRGTDFFGSLVTCPLCLSVWLAAVLVAISLPLPPVGYVVAVLAVSGGASAIELGVRRG